MRSFTEFLEEKHPELLPESRLSRTPRHMRPSPIGLAKAKEMKDKIGIDNSYDSFRKDSFNRLAKTKDDSGDLLKVVAPDWLPWATEQEPEDLDYYRRPRPMRPSPIGLAKAKELEREIGSGYPYNDEDDDPYDPYRLTKRRQWRHNLGNAKEFADRLKNWHNKQGPKSAT